MRQLVCIVSALGSLASIAIAQVPSVPTNGLVNGASFQVGAPVAAGSLVSIFGTDLASSVASADTVPLTTTLGSATVNFQTAGASFEAPLLYAQGDNPAQNIGSQINAQIPWELAPTDGANATVNIVVTNAGVASAPIQVVIAPAAPAIFVLGARAIVTNLDGSLTWTTGAVAGVTSHAAKPGDIVVVYATGLGAVDSPIADGASSLDKLRNAVNKPTVLIGGVSATVMFAGLNPGFVGLNQLNVVVPDVPPGDEVPIQIQSAGISSPDAVTISVTQ